MAQGPYDAGTQFLLDTMHDPRVPLWRRIECAKFLLDKHPNEFRVHWLRDARDPDPNPAVPVLRIVIEGFGAPASVSVEPERIAEDHTLPRLN
jgi:hypothetical protein